MAESCGRRLKRSRAWHRARWRKHVVAQGESGLSVVVYCRDHGLVRESFYRWRRVFLAEEAGASVSSARGVSQDSAADTDASASAVFAELRLPLASDTTAASGVEVVLAGERRLRLESGFDEDTLRRAVVALEVLPC